MQKLNSNQDIKLGTSYGLKHKSSEGCPLKSDKSSYNGASSRHISGFPRVIRILWNIRMKLGI